MLRIQRKQPSKFMEGCFFSLGSLRQICETPKVLVKGKTVKQAQNPGAKQGVAFARNGAKAFRPISQ
jgi:hypothetical protein